MKVLFTSACKPLPIFLDRFLSIDDVSYRFIVDQGPFSASADVPCFSLHFLAQNINVPSVVLEWPTFDELQEELESDHYDFVAISFKVLDMDRVDEMVEFIHRVSPRSQVVLGGYGTLALNEPQFARLRDTADHVCFSGDGTRFLRELVGDTSHHRTVARLPTEEVSIPWLSRIAQMSTRAGYLLSALGCVWRCEFCCTSAYAGGRIIDVMDDGEIFDSMKWYYSHYPDMKHVFVMDEELLLRKPKVEAIGRRIRDDDEHGLSRMSYLGFGTIKALSRWDPEELLLNGVGEFWTGVESKFSYQRKKGESDQQQLVRDLQAHGIESQLSWIVGDDCQTKENIQEDVEYLIGFRPCTVQLTTLSAFPGTALYERLRKDGRIPPMRPEEYHLFGNTMESLHFTHEERVRIILDTYRRIYEAQGPSVMRALGVYMNGYEYCLRSSNPYLNGPKLEFFKKRIQYSIFLAKTAIEFAPSEQARKAMEDVLKRYQSLLGPLRKSQSMLAERCLRLATEDMERRAGSGSSSIRDVPLKRYLYHGPPTEPPRPVTRETLEASA